MTRLAKNTDRHGNLCLRIEAHRGNMGPCGTLVRACSRCGTDVPPEDVPLRRLNVRDALQPPSFCLDAVLCGECWENRQRWLEDLANLRRGTKVRLKDGRASIVASWFDEDYFVNERGYCVPLSMVDKGAPAEPTLF